MIKLHFLSHDFSVALLKFLPFLLLPLIFHSHFCQFASVFPVEPPLQQPKLDPCHNSKGGLVSDSPTVSFRSIVILERVDILV